MPGQIKKLKIKKTLRISQYKLNLSYEKMQWIKLKEIFENVDKKSNKELARLLVALKNDFEDRAYLFKKGL